MIAEWEACFESDPTILEIGCGDLVWHGDELPARYIGLDLHARDTWNARGHRDGAAFIRGNAATSPLGQADIAIARQVFIHLSNQVILAILDNLRKHEIRWLLASTVPMGENVERLPAGQDYSIDGYAVDLAVDPFNLAYALPLHRGGAMRLFKL